MPAGPPELRRTIGLIQATAMVVGTIIGASIFVQPSQVTGAVPSLGGVFTVWAVSGVLTLFGALVCAELASVFPRTGGVYVFLRETYSPALGFLWGWAMFWTMHSGIIAVIAMVFARYFGFFVSVTDTGTKAVAISAIVVLSAVNFFGVKPGSWLQTGFTIGKVLAVLLIIVLGFTLGARLPKHFVVQQPNVSVTVAGFVQALIAGLFAFGGWHMVTYAAEETMAPERTIPRALLAGTLLVTACYIALNAVYLYVLPLETVAASTRVAADGADALLGRGGGGVMSGLVMFSTFGALSGIILGGPRVYLSMARDGSLFSWLGAVHPRYRTPHRAIWLQAGWASVLVATGTFRVLFTRVVYTEWIFFGLLGIGLVLLRRNPEYRPRYAIWGYPVVPLVFAVSSGLIVLQQVVSEPGESAFGLALVAIGLPVYLVWMKARHANH